MAYDIAEAQQLVIRAGKELLGSGLVARTWGNMSARISESQFVITPSGLPYETLTPGDIVAVSIADCTYEGDVKPSSEKGVHAAVYRQHPEADFVIHTHQNYATDLSILGRNLRILPGGAASELLGECVPCARYGLSSTKTLTRNVEEELIRHPSSRAVLMRNHGAVCFGDSYEEAFRVAHTLEDECRRRYGKLTGSRPPAYSLRDHGRVFLRGSSKEQPEYEAIFRAKPAAACVIFTDAPCIREYSAYGIPLLPYVDDLAQLVGAAIPVRRADASPEAIARAVKGTTGAVLLRNTGAIVTGENREDAEALAMILDKACQMGLLARCGWSVQAVSPAAAIYEHLHYVHSYSRLATR